MPGVARSFSITLRAPGMASLRKAWLCCFARSAERCFGPCFLGERCGRNESVTTLFAFSRTAAWIAGEKTTSGNYPRARAMRCRGVRRPPTE
jgi:hypothetical protein